MDFICQTLREGKGRPQFKRYISGIIHDNPVDNLAQKVFLILALQTIIQCSDLRDNLKRHFQIFNVHLLTHGQGLKRSPNLIAAILPFCPQSLPDFVTDFTRCIQAYRAVFFLVDRFEDCFQAAAFMSPGTANLSIQLSGVGCLDLWYEVWVHLYAGNGLPDGLVECDGTSNAGCTSNGNTAIALYEDFSLISVSYANLTIVHELGHRFDNQSGTNNIQQLSNRMDRANVILDCNTYRIMGTNDDDLTGPFDWKRGLRGWGTSARPSQFQQNPLETLDPSSDNSIDETNELSEAAADMFLNCGLAPNK